MKRQDFVLKLSGQLLFVLLLIGLMSSASLVLAQNSQQWSGQRENVRSEETPSLDSVYYAWMLAVRYRFEEVPDNYDISHDPKMSAIWSLREDDLRYFLDSIAAINRVQNIMFPPASSSSLSTQNMTLFKERELVEIVTDRVFSENTNDQVLQTLNEHEKAYVAALEEVVNAIVRGDGDRFLTPKYLQYRAEIIPFIEDTGAKLFDPSQEVVDMYLEYFSIEGEQSVDLNLAPAPQASCTTTYTIDNWPSKSTIFSGNTGSSWREAKAHDQNDCDIFVSYFMGSTPHYGVISANTSSAQCVLDKTSQLRGSWSGNFNNVQYGKVTVTWGWPFGCNTTGNALRSATKWRP